MKSVYPRSLPLDWQSQPEPRSCALIGVQPQIAAVIDYGLMRERQSQAQAIFLPCAYEGVEEPRADLSCDSRSGILHLD